MPANPDNRRLPLSAPKIAAAQESVSLARERAMRQAGGRAIEAARLLWQWTRQNTSLREAMIKVAVIAWTDQRADARAIPTLDGNALSGREGTQGPQLDLWAAGIPTPAPPAEISAIADAIGPAATLRLVEDFAGQKLYVPRVPREGSTLAEAIGLQEALALANVLGGEAIKVPSLKAWRARVYKARGMSNSQIARALGVDLTTVGRYLNPIVSHLSEVDGAKPKGRR